MKCVSMFAVAAMALAAVAQEPAVTAAKPMRARPERPMAMGGMGAMGAFDPVLRAVMNPAVAKQLNLTEEQTAKLKALGDGRGDNKELQEKVRKGMMRQSELLKAEKIDEAAVMAAIDEVWEARKEIAKRQTKRVIAVKSILTAEQVAKATEALKTLRGAHRGPRPEGVKRGEGRKAAAKDKAQE